MRFDCGPTSLELWQIKYNRLSSWHPWFAWKPTRMAGHECAWLERIERKGYMHRGFWHWEYRYPPLDPARVPVDPTPTPRTKYGEQLPQQESDK
jgi:hypothetical protein